MKANTAVPKPRKTILDPDKPGRRRSRWGAPIPIISTPRGDCTVTEAAERVRAGTYHAEQPDLFEVRR